MNEIFKSMMESFEDFCKAADEFIQKEKSREADPNGVVRALFSPNDDTI